MMKLVLYMIMLYADEALSHKEESKSQGESYYIVVATAVRWQPWWILRLNEYNILHPLVSVKDA
jgi:hypothetical protein